MQVHDEMVFDFPKGADPRQDLEDEKAGRTKFRKLGGSNLWRARVLQKLMEQGGEDINVPTPVGVKYHAVHWAEGMVV